MAAAAAAAAAAAPTAAVAAAAAAIGAVAVAAAYADHERKRRSGRKRKRDQLENQQPVLALQDFPPAYRAVAKRLLPFAWNITKWLQGQRRSDGVNIHRDLEFTRVCDVVAGEHLNDVTECIHCSNIHSLTSIMAGFVRGGLNLTRLPLDALVFKGNPVTCLYRAIAPHIDFNKSPAVTLALQYERVPHAVGMLLFQMIQPWPQSILDDVISRTHPDTLIHHQSVVSGQKVPLLHALIRRNYERPVLTLLRLANDDGTGLQITQQALDLARNLLPRWDNIFGTGAELRIIYSGNSSATVTITALESKAECINAHRKAYLSVRIDAATGIPEHAVRVLIAEYTGPLFDTCPYRALLPSDAPALAAAAAAAAAPARSAS